MSSDVEYSVDPNKTSGGLYLNIWKAKKVATFEQWDVAKDDVICIRALSYHNVTTSFEYVWLGTDFSLAKPKK